MFKGEYETCDRCEITAPIQDMYYDYNQLMHGEFGSRLDWFCEDCATDLLKKNVLVAKHNRRVLNRWKDDVR